MSVVLEYKHRNLTAEGISDFLTNVVAREMGERDCTLDVSFNRLDEKGLLIVAEFVRANAKVICRKHLVSAGVPGALHVHMQLQNLQFPRLWVYSLRSYTLAMKSQPTHTAHDACAGAVGMRRVQLFYFRQLLQDARGRRNDRNGGKSTHLHGQHAI